MRRPPRLVTRTLGVTFITVAVILSVVFTVLLVDARDRVRAAELEKLQVGERAYSRFETQRQREQAAAMAAFGESSTLKAALDTYSSVATRPASGSSRDGRAADHRGPRGRAAGDIDVHGHRRDAGSRGPRLCERRPGGGAAGARRGRAVAGRPDGVQRRRRAERRHVPLRQHAAAARRIVRWGRCSSAPSSATTTRASWRGCRTPGSSSPSTTAWWPAPPATR